MFLSGEPLSPRVVRPTRYANLYGSQAVLMRREAAFKAWAVTIRAECATDTSLIKAWGWNRLVVGVRVPHAVQHRADKTLHDERVPSSKRNPEWQTSRSFLLPRSLVAE